MSISGCHHNLTHLIYCPHPGQSRVRQSKLLNRSEKKNLWLSDVLVRVCTPLLVEGSVVSMAAPRPRCFSLLYFPVLKPRFSKTIIVSTPFVHLLPQPLPSLVSPSFLPLLLLLLSSSPSSPFFQLPQKSNTWGKEKGGRRRQVKSYNLSFRKIVC